MKLTRSIIVVIISTRIVHLIETQSAPEARIGARPASPTGRGGNERPHSLAPGAMRQRALMMIKKENAELAVTSSSIGE